jgi:hypothetical protein
MQHKPRHERAIVAAVSARLAAASLAVGGLVLLTVWLTDLSFERAALLAPVLVLGIAAVAGLLVLWGRVAWQQLSESRHPRAILVLSALGVALIVALSLLGVKLPHE